MKFFSQLFIKRNYLLMGFSLITTVFNFSCKQENNESRTKSDTLVLFDFEGQQNSIIEAQDATFELIDEGSNAYVKVNSGHLIREPGIKLKTSEENPWNLEGFYQIMADVQNLGNESIQVELFVGNDPDDLIRWYCSDYVDLEPGESKTITVDLAWTPYVFDPPVEVNGLRGVPGKIKTDVSKIRELTFSTRYSNRDNVFSVDNVRAVGNLEKRDPKDFFPFIDEFGQYIHADWKNKMHSENDLKKAGERELAMLLNDPGPEGLGKYKGWKTGPKLNATGFFRTEKVDGKWWMIDPEGYLFWTAGLNCVSSSSVFTGITDREKYFAFLPEKESPYGQFYGVSHIATHGFYKDKLPYDVYNFYQSNLYRKYGEDWLSDFRDIIHLRIKNWGLNTIGFMSDFGAVEQKKTPYVGSIWINDTPKIQGSEGFWGKFHDVFDPQFRIAVRNSIELQKQGAGDPYCIGFFVDNELSWGLLGSLSIGTLKSPSSQPAKIEFVRDLRKKYGDIKNLNEVWLTDHDSWEDLLNTKTPPDQKRSREDLIAFYGKIADTYFETINSELKRVAPNQNYLGCRFAWANNDVVLRSASKFVDIMSFNKYEYSVEKLKLPNGVDKPVMIGEFHFGALDRGSFHVGIKKAKDQKERGQFYQDYIRGALRNPNIVGAHWFQFIDEPNTGRFDGENYNVGFVDICDNPFDELIDKVRETTYLMYEYRSQYKNEDQLIVSAD